jgi:glycosyltransferase involved in cell wall biosynthesis
VRIGVDATCWANARGYGRFARELLRAMTVLAPSDEFLCLGDRRALAVWRDPRPNLRLVEVEQDESPTLAAASNGHRSPRDMLRLTRAVHRARPDVFFSPSVYTYFPLPPGQRAVVTVHDTIAERFPGLTLPTPRARLFWKLKVSLAIRQADLILTVSEYSARSIVDVLGVPRARIRVAVEAPAPAYSPSATDDVTRAAARAGLPPGARWFAYVGGFNPHKRLDTIIEAHAALARASTVPPRLLLVGSVAGDVFHGEVERLRSLIREAGTESLVRWTGFIEDEELRHLLSGAVASLLPSEAEGFGLPAVEAAACGTPVIATLESPLPELLEGGGLFLRPGDVPALTAAMRNLLADEAQRASLGRAARERASRLTWTASAREALAAIHEAAA